MAVGMKNQAVVECRNGESINVEGECRRCGEKHCIGMERSEWEAWLKGELIQRAMPKLDSDARELLLSGLCGKCFDSIFDG